MKEINKIDASVTAYKELLRLSLNPNGILTKSGENRNKVYFETLILRNQGRLI